MTRVGESKLLEQTSHIGRQTNGQKVLNTIHHQKMEIKTTRRYHYTITKMTKI